MRPLVLLLFAAVTVAGPAHAARSAPEDVIAKALDGRVAGKGTNCINQQQIRSTQIVDRTAILYSMNNGTVYLNRPRSGGAFLRDDVALVTRSSTSQLCNVDIVSLYDTGSRSQRGSVGLGDFIPYDKPRRVRAD